MARILVDMDGVLANWGARYDAGLDAQGSAARFIPRTRDQRTFELFADRSNTECDVIHKVLSEPGFYADLQPIPGAIRAMQDLSTDGHDVRICTSPWVTNPTCVQDKFDWVERHLGREWLSQIIMTNDKAMVAADVLIDDRPDIPGAWAATWNQVLFDQPYNGDPENSIPRPRIRDWAEWRSVIEPLLAALEPVKLDSLAAVKSAPLEVRVVSATGGAKGVKPQRYDLIPVMPLDRLAELYARGAEKYDSHNWRRGYDWSNSYAAAMRHMTRFWNGEDIDPEMGLPHTVCAAFHMFALTQFLEDFPEYDDRYKSPVSVSVEGSD